MLGVRTARQSGLVSVLPVDSLGSEVHAGGSVDLQSARDAPAGEFCRIEINTLGDRALALELSFRPLGTMEPLVVGGRELRRIRYLKSLPGSGRESCLVCHQNMANGSHFSAHQ